MPYYLNNPSATNVAVTISPVPLDTLGDYFEVKMFANSGNPGDQWRFAGAQIGYTPLAAAKADTFLTRFDSGAFVDRRHNAGIAIGEIFTLRVEKTTATEWEYFLNGVSFTSPITQSSVTFEQFFRLSTSSTEALKGAIYYFEMGNSSGVTNRWENTTGTGSTFGDSVGGNDGTLLNFPTDDSQWVFYAPPAVTPINPSITNLLATSARLTWEQG